MNKDKVRELHRLRQQEIAIDAETTRRRKAYEARMDDVFSGKTEVMIRIAEIEDQLKAQRVEEYDGEDKGKTFGVGIREVLKLDYSVAAAFRWAIAHEIALQLDKKIFEKLAKADPPDFVTSTTTVTATIATDLGEYLED